MRESGGGAAILGGPEEAHVPDLGMFGDDGPTIDRATIDYAVREAEVLLLGFDFTPDRLLIDMRNDREGHTPPIVELVEPLADAAERQVWLAGRRPGLPPPARFMFFTWPHSVHYLAVSPLITRTTARIRSEQGVDLRELIADALHDLRRREHRDLLSAVRGGEGFETLWSRDRFRRE